MNDKELADRVVALGVGDTFHPNRRDQGMFYAPPGYDRKEYLSVGMCAPNFVRDWRVAGALMEKCLVDRPEGDMYSGWCPKGKQWVVNYDEYNDSSILTGNSLPRAIIEACVEALNEC